MTPPRLSVSSVVRVIAPSVQHNPRLRGSIGVPFSASLKPAALTARRESQRVIDTSSFMQRPELTEVRMRIMLRVVIACSASLLVAGCAKRDQAATDSAAGAASTPAAATPAPAPAPPTTLSLADVAGKWQVRSVPEAGTDTTATTYVLTATADTTGWMITFPSGLKVPVHVTVSGDSVIEKTGTFASQRRKGVKVTTEGSFRLQGGKLVGTTIAHYSKAGPDSVLRLRTEGTKMP